jgi:hypothetical protein
MPTLSEKLGKMRGGEPATERVTEPSRAYYPNVPSDPIPVIVIDTTPEEAPSDAASFMASPSSASFVSPTPPLSSEPIEVAPVAPVAATIPVAAIPITPVASVASVAASETETTTFQSQGTLTPDPALEIADDEDYYYEDDDYEERERIGSPVFILIVFVILIIQVFFVGLLVSLDLIDIGSIMEFFGNLGS